ncbi:hypothetical protein HanPSC8_Chr10g0436031 [Helianthus annuus]|nr:hypothetical protein HanPSC8_Chr10g0436031 [Helianthus annuus]
MNSDTISYNIHTCSCELLSYPIKKFGVPPGISLKVIHTTQILSRETPYIQNLILHLRRVIGLSTGHNCHGENLVLSCNKAEMSTKLGPYEPCL